MMIFPRSRRIFRTLIGVVLMCVASASLHAAEATDAPLDRFFRGLETLSAQFEQTIVDAGGKVTQRATGRLSIQRPGRFRWDYDTPYKQLVLGDGDQLWTYDADLEQATVKPQEAALAGTPALLLSAREQPRELFTVRSLPPRNGEHWYELTPTSEQGLGDTQFNQLRLGFTGDSLVAMELVDGFDQTTQIRFSDLQRNGPLASGLFDFTPPAGVDVIGEPQ
jgi:outer membrane lipoprotein carrier protein